MTPDLAAAPRWTCAVLIMDLCGFSKMSETAGIDAAYAARARFCDIARGQVDAAGGIWVKAWADNFAAVFATITAAEATARAIQARVRCAAGIGFGETTLPLGDLWGVEVNRASKLGEDEAGPGEIRYTKAATAWLARLGR